MSVCLLNIMSVQSYAIHTRNIPTRSSRISMEEVNQSPSWAAARWPLVVWEPGDSASQCHGVLNISEISPPSILWQQPAVTCDSFYLHTALHCTPHCNNARVPQFGLDNVINCWQATWLAKILKTVRQLQTSIEHPNFKFRPTSLCVWKR